jgi:hypothetical protein
MRTTSGKAGVIPVTFASRWLGCLENLSCLLWLWLRRQHTARSVGRDVETRNIYALDEG